MRQLKHVLRAGQFSRDDMNALFEEARLMEQWVQGAHSSPLWGNKIMGTLFLKRSMLTLFAFTAAMRRLGGNVVSLRREDVGSLGAAGNGLEDAVRILGGQVDVLVLRDDTEDSLARALSVSPVPVVSGGDGRNNHPTQTLADLFTIERELGRMDDITIAAVGDVAGNRSVRSLCSVAPLFRNWRIIYVAPQKQRDAPCEIRKQLDQAGVAWECRDSVQDAAPEADVVYMTHLPRESFMPNMHEYRSERPKFILDSAVVARMPKNSIIMHPLRRGDEIAVKVDSDPRAAYFRQSDNSLYVRMALLDMLFGRARKP